MEKELDFFDQERVTREKSCNPEEFFKSVNRKEEKKLKKVYLGLTSIKRISAEIKAKEAQEKTNSFQPDFSEDENIEEEVINEIKEEKEDPSEEYYGRFNQFK